jgi:hypothetical protein
MDPWFINLLQCVLGFGEMKQNFPTKWHFLIMDGHNSCVTFQTICRVASHGLDILTLLFDTSLFLQALEG